MIGAHAVGYLLSAEQARGLDHGALSMHPLGLNRVEPGTLDRQVAGQNADAMALLLDLPIVRPDPGAYSFTDVPGGVVPDQPPPPPPHPPQFGAPPLQELIRTPLAGPPRDKPP